MCENEGAGLYPYPHSFYPFFPPDPGGMPGTICRTHDAPHLSGAVGRTHQATGSLAPLNDVSQRGHCALWLSWKSHSE